MLLVRSTIFTGGSVNRGLTCVVYNGVIMTHSSSTGSLVDVLKGAPALCEDIEGKRFLPFIDEVDGLICTAHGIKWKNGAEYLFLRWRERRAKSPELDLHCYSSC